MADALVYAGLVAIVSAAAWVDLRLGLTVLGTLSIVCGVLLAKGNA